MVSTDEHYTQPSSTTPIVQEVAISFVPSKYQRVHKWGWIPWLLLVSTILCSLGTFYAFASKETKQEVIVPAPVVVVEASSSTDPIDLIYSATPLLSLTDFFDDTKKAFMREKQSFIEANLSAMTIAYYEKGELVFEAPILTKGKEGSWWETPAGLYKVDSKSEKHFSSFGQVYTPWNLAFQGNFFIHGWPYYPDGTPVESQFSGGCIRLSDTDAEKLFAYATVETPVLVYEKDYMSDGFTYAVPVPTVEAKAYLVADIESNTILAQGGEELQLPIASLTKLMTALVAAEYINLDKEITIPDLRFGSTSVPRLKKGMQMSSFSLLLPLLLESSNEAAQVLGSLLGTDRYVSLMNAKAKSLGMDETQFTDTSGAHAGNLSTVKDLFQLVRYIHNNRSFVYLISSGEPLTTLYTVYAFGDLYNFNRLPDLTGFVGGKVGQTTAAKETIISVYKMEIDGQQRTLAFIVLGAPDNYQAVTELYNYMITHYKAVPVKP